MTHDSQELTVSGHATEIQPDAINAKLLASAGVLLILLLLLIVVSLSAWYYAASNLARDDVQARPSQALQEMRAQQEAQLQYRWIDCQHRIAAIPIEVAMQRVQRELQSPAPPHSQEVHP